jgi:hypothetical protein
MTMNLKDSGALNFLTREKRGLQGESNDGKDRGGDLAA